MQDIGTTWYDWKKCDLDKTERCVLVCRYEKSWGSACDWVVPATVYVTAPNCQVYKMAQQTHQFLAGSENVGLTINKKF